MSARLNSYVVEKRQNGRRTFIYYNESLCLFLLQILRRMNRARMNRVHRKSMKVTKQGVRVRNLYLIQDDEKIYDFNYS